ncbi:MAG: alkaline phosphatase family protein [Bifidobacterium mongoliense]|nr:alkaline phosphatase family protein [Bifidobacterium mongoliense]
MGVELPSREELLHLVTTTRYGDGSPQAVSTDGSRNPSHGSSAVRGGLLLLSSVLPALSDAIGAPVATTVHHDPAAARRALGIPEAPSAIVVLVDGLGFWNINARIGHTPYLRSLMRESVNQRSIATCSPSTTAAAMATFGTGTCPGMTGMTGYTQRNPQTGRLEQLIQFKEAPEPTDLQRQPTIFEGLAAQGVRVTSCGLPKFAHSPLTDAAFRGSHYVGDERAGDRVRATVRAASSPGLTYLYIRDTDKIGHNYGWQSERWIEALERVDSQLGMLHRLAPAGTVIVIVADHGMISSDPRQRLDLRDRPDLARDVALVGGEPRAVMLYAEPGADPGVIAGRWSEALEGRAIVRTRQEAIEAGAYGPVDPRVEPMLGDVLVSAGEQLTIVDSRTQSDKATRLPSVHGSMSLLESDIPCLIDLI